MPPVEPHSDAISSGVSRSLGASKLEKSADQQSLETVLPAGRAFWKKFILSIVVLLAATVVLAYFFKTPLEEASQWFMGNFGLLGLAGGVVLTDSWALPPMTHEPLLFAAHASGVSYLVIVAVAGTASVCGGMLGYLYGMVLGRSTRVRGFLHRSGVQMILENRPFTVVAVAAFTPLPFAPTTWTAGVLRIPFFPFLLGCCFRYLKIAFYLSIIVAGWGAV
ncbi:MAG: hypothetical protein GY822_24465 [Deltaproteobacteria bacterium]|nr:hypothetical protein [Deltaproteobacteria bacterium]